MADLLALKKEMITFPVMLVGESGAGKTSVMMRYTRNEFDVQVKSTLGIQFLDKKITYKDKKIKVELWDTSGQQIYRAIPITRFKRAKSIIFVYDLCDQKHINGMFSFWIPTAISSCAKNTVYVVFGNKSDKMQEPTKLQQIKQKIDEKLQKISDDNKIQFFSFVGNCLQSQNKGITNMIDKIVEVLYQNKQEEQKLALQQQRLQRERGQIQKPPVRKSAIIIQNQNKKEKGEKKRKFCF